MKLATSVVPLNRIVKYALCLYCSQENEYQLANGWADDTTPAYHGTIWFKSTHQYKPLKMDTSQSCKTFSSIVPLKSLLHDKASWTNTNPYIFFFNEDNQVEAIVPFDFKDFESVLIQYLP